MRRKCVESDSLISDLAPPWGAIAYQMQSARAESLGEIMWVSSLYPVSGDFHIRRLSISHTLSPIRGARESV